MGSNPTSSAINYYIIILYHILMGLWSFGVPQYDPHFEFAWWYNGQYAPPRGSG